MFTRVVPGFCSNMLFLLFAIFALGATLQESRQDSGRASEVGATALTLDTEQIKVSQSPGLHGAGPWWSLVLVLEQGLVNVPFWGYWTSPKIVAI